MIDEDDDDDRDHGSAMLFWVVERFFGAALQPRLQAGLLFGASLDCNGNHSIIIPPGEETCVRFKSDFYIFTTSGFCRGS